MQRRQDEGTAGLGEAIPDDQDQALRTYVLDTSVLLSDPRAISRFAEHNVVIPVVVISELEGKRHDPEIGYFARQALRLIGANIEKAVFDGKDVDARGAMLLGSLLAGQAFANSPVAAVHALAYPIGGTFHVPHGLSNALVLPHVLRFNASEAAHLYAEIASDAFPGLAREEGIQGRCAAFIEELASLSKTLGLQARLRDVGIGQQHLEKMAADAMKQQRLLVNNPRSVAETDALAIYRAAW